MNPFPTPPKPYVEPNPRIPKTIGTLNIVFAACLMLCGACGAMQLIARPFVNPMMQVQQQQTQAQMQAAMEAQRKAEIDALKEQEQTAETEEEKADLQAQRRAIEARPKPVLPDFNKVWGMNDPRVTAFAWAELLSGFVLNILMLVAGIALLGLREWGRMLALGVAALKILRSILVYGFFAIVITPIVAKQMGEFIADVNQQMAAQANRPMPPAPPPQQFAAGFGMMLAVYAVGMILLGAVYPIVTLCLLTRPGAKAACQPIEAETDEPWQT